MEAVYNAQKGIYVATGYFDESNHSYIPGTLRVPLSSISGSSSGCSFTGGAGSSSGTALRCVQPPKLPDIIRQAISMAKVRFIKSPSSHFLCLAYPSRCKIHTVKHFFFYNSIIKGSDSICKGEPSFAQENG